MQRSHSLFSGGCAQLNTSLTVVGDERVFQVGPLPGSSTELVDATHWFLAGVSGLLLVYSGTLLVSQLRGKRADGLPSSAEQPFAGIFTLGDEASGDVGAAAAAQRQPRKAVIALLVKLLVFLYFAVELAAGMVFALFFDRLYVLCLAQSEPSAATCRLPVLVFQLLTSLSAFLLQTLLVLLTLFWSWLSNLVQRRETEFRLLLLDFGVLAAVNSLLYVAYLAAAAVYWTSALPKLTWLSVLLAAENLCAALLVFFGARMFRRLRDIGGAASPFAVKLFVLNGVAVSCIAVDDALRLAEAVLWPLCPTEALTVASAVAVLLLRYLPAALLLIAVGPRFENKLLRRATRCCPWRQRSTRSAQLSNTAGDDYDSFVPDIDSERSSRSDDSNDDDDDDFYRESLIIAKARKTEANHLFSEVR